MRVAELRALPAPRRLPRHRADHHGGQHEAAVEPSPARRHAEAEPERDQQRQPAAERRIGDVHVGRQQYFAAEEGNRRAQHRERAFEPGAFARHVAQDRPGGGEGEQHTREPDPRQAQRFIIVVAGDEEKFPLQSRQQHAAATGPQLTDDIMPPRCKRGPGPGHLREHRQRDPPIRHAARLCPPPAPRSPGPAVQRAPPSRGRGRLPSAAC